MVSLAVTVESCCSLLLLSGKLIPSHSDGPDQAVRGERLYLQSEKTTVVDMSMMKIDEPWPAAG